MSNATLTIEKAEALKQYKGASAAKKKLLEELFGKEAFIGSIMDIIDSPEAAYKLLGLIRSNEIPFKNPKSDRQLVANTQFDLDVIAEALQQKWEADYDDLNQAKWHVWFKKQKGAGFVVSGADCVGGSASSSVGARRCFPSQELALYFGNQFIKLHNIILLKTKQNAKSNTKH